MQIVVGVSVFSTAWAWLVDLVVMQSGEEEASSSELVLRWLLAATGYSRHELIPALDVAAVCLRWVLLIQLDVLSFSSCVDQKNDDGALLLLFTLFSSCCSCACFTRIFFFCGNGSVPLLSMSELIQVCFNFAGYKFDPLDNSHQS